MIRTSAQTQNPVWFYAFALGPVIIWAINMVVTRYAASVIEPISISFWRLSLAWLLLTPFLGKILYQHRQQLQKNIMPCAVLASLGMVSYQCLSYWAAQSTTATNMSMINALIPIFTIFVSLLLLAVRPNRYAIAGSVLSLCGLIFFIGHGSFAVLWQGTWQLGDGLMLIAVLAYALYGVLIRYWQMDLPLLLSVWLQISLAIIMHIPLIWLLGLQMLDQQNIWPVVYAAILPSIAAPFLWMKAMQTIGPNQATMFTHLGPILTAVIAYIYLDEQWYFYHTVGAALAILGVVLAQKKSSI